MHKTNFINAFPQYPTDEIINFTQSVFQHFVMISKQVSECQHGKWYLFSLVENNGGWGLFNV